ncbi:MAG: POTRA domain-containing protein [Bacteroidota bacterium]
MSKNPIWAAVVLLTFGLNPSSASARQREDSTFTVREIMIRGNERTKESVIRREMTVTVGDTLRSGQLERDRDRIYNLGLFNKVDVDFKKEGTEADVTVTVYERWYIFPFPVFGIRYRDPSKLFYGAGITDQNFRGRNEKVFFSFAVGYDSWVSLSYQTPKLTDDDDIFFRAQVSYQHLHNLNVENGEYEQRHFFSGLSLGKRYGLYQTLVGEVAYEVWQVSDLLIGRTASSDGRDAFFSTSLHYTFDDRNLREYATGGNYVFLGITKEGFGKSEVNLMRYAFDMRAYTPVLGDVSAAGRVFGTLTGGGVVPSYRHVYYGYDERLRGYFRQVREAEEITGGNLELRIPLLLPRYYRAEFISIPQFSVLRYGLYFGIFADAGKIWYRTQPFRDVPLYSGYGAGIHFLLPYGLTIRTEYAFNNEGGREFFVDFGASF